MSAAAARRPAAAAAAEMGRDADADAPPPRAAGRAASAAELAADFLRSAGRDFRADFPKFLLSLALAVSLASILLPVGVVFLAVPAAVVLALATPLCLVACVVLAPVAALAAAHALYGDRRKRVRAAQKLTVLKCWALHHATRRVLHPVLTAWFRFSVGPVLRPSAELQALGVLVRATRRPGRVTLDRFRAACNGYAILFFYRKPVDHDLWHVPAPGPGAGLRTVPCHYLRTAREPAQVHSTVLYLHGGGFVAGTAGVYRGMIAPVATRLNCNVVAPEYRKMPEHLLPAAVDDAVAAYRYLTVEKRVDPATVVFAGDSAGAALCLLTLLRIRDDAGLQQPAGALLMSPYVDLTCSTDSWTRNEGRDFILNPAMIAAAKKMWKSDFLPYGFTEDAARSFSPYFLPADAFAGLPPLRVSVSSAEPLVDEVRVVRDKLRAAGVTVEYDERDGCPHVFTMFYAYCPEARESMDSAVEFLAGCLARRGAAPAAPAGAAARHRQG